MKSHEKVLIKRNEDMNITTNQIYPCLWFDGQAKEAAEFYCDIYQNSQIITDTSLAVTFKSAGQKFMCLNGGPHFTPNPSISFYVISETRKEVEHYWNQLNEGGKVLMPLDHYEWSEKYGWIQDRYGISWQLSYEKSKEVGQKFSPLLMFTGDQAGKAEEAIRFYTSIFRNSSISRIMKYRKGDPDVEGKVKHAQFRLDGQVMMAMDSSLPHNFGFNEGISLVVECGHQTEIDYFWDRLTAGGEEGQCGWLKDRYGVSWQIVPSILGILMMDPEKAPFVREAFLKMKKLDIETLVSA